MTTTLDDLNAVISNPGELVRVIAKKLDVLTTGEVSSAGRAGTVALANGATAATVLFSSALAATPVVTAQLLNTVDGSPTAEAVTITALSATGFTAKFAAVGTANYSLMWAAIPAA